VSASQDGLLRAWDLGEGRRPRILRGHTSVIYGVAVAADRSFWASADEDAHVLVWDPSRTGADSPLTGHGDGVTGLHAEPGGARLATT